MIAVTHIIIWWLGALVAFGLLIGATALLGSAAKIAAKHFTVNALWLASVVTYRYWLGRMKSEGLMAMSENYQRLVRERRPKTPGEFEEVSREADKLDGTNLG